MNTKFKHIQQEALEIFNSTLPSPVTIENSNPNQCKFHLDNEQDTSDSNTLFCGKPCFKNYSYCAWHYIKAHDIKK